MTCIRSFAIVSLATVSLLTSQALHADELKPATYPGQISIAAFVTAPPGKEKEFIATFTKFAQEVRAEPGCVNFDVHQNSKIANRFFVYENFKDQAAFDQHAKGAHTQKFVEFLNSSGGVLQFENWNMVTERRAL